MSDIFSSSKSESDTECNNEIITLLKESATNAPLKRSRICLHKDHNDKVQEMIIAVCNKSYIAPHRQVGKRKSYHIIEGRFLVVFFDDNGKIEKKIKMSDKKEKNPFIYSFKASKWHTVYSLSDFVVYLEVIEGPYKKEDTEYADWSPKTNNMKEVNNFFNKLISYK